MSVCVIFFYYLSLFIYCAFLTSVLLYQCVIFLFIKIFCNPLYLKRLDLQLRLFQGKVSYWWRLLKTRLIHPWKHTWKVFNAKRIQTTCSARVLVEWHLNISRPRDSDGIFLTGATLHWLTPFELETHPNATRSVHTADISYCGHLLPSRRRQEFSIQYRFY